MAYDPTTTQGNIIHAFGTRRGVYLFLRFLDRESARAQLAKTLPSFVTSAQEQTDVYFNKTTRKRHVYGAFGLSWKGYQFLGLADYLPPGHPNDLAWFKAGADGVSEKAFYKLRWKPEVELWEPEYRETPIHAVVILASDSAGAVQSKARALKKTLSKVAQIVAHENTFGKIWRFDEVRRPREHFGHRDGISKLEKTDVALVEEGKLGLPDTNGTHGSFLAILKLEQNPYKFRREAEDLAEKLGETCGTRKVTWRDVQANAVGRHTDGRPLIPEPESVSGKVDKYGDPVHYTEFKFNLDPKGEMCPMHAHVRKMNNRETNPRTGVLEGAAYKVVRRGMSYGPEREDFTSNFDQLPPSDGVGLMFTSYQANILSLLTLLHVANDPNNLDATIGRVSGRTNVQPQSWNGGGCEVKKLMSDFVTPRGGGYFFAPSMTFIKNIDRL